MDTANAVIAVLDELGKKFGIMIDWSQNNIQPYAQELMNRVVKYEITTSLIWIVFHIILLVSVFLILRYYIKYDNSKERTDYKGKPDRSNVIFAISIGAMCCVPLLLYITVQILDIVKAVTIPEMTFIAYIQRYL